MGSNGPDYDYVTINKHIQQIDVRTQIKETHLQ